VAGEWKLGLLNGVLGVCTFSAALLAFRYGNAPVMAALRETSVVMAALIGTIVLGERPWKQRVAAAVLVSCGVTLLTGFI